MSTTVETATMVRASGAVSVMPAETFWNAYGRAMRGENKLTFRREIVMMTSVSLRYSRIVIDGERFATVIPTTHERA